MTNGMKLLPFSVKLVFVWIWLTSICGFFVHRNLHELRYPLYSTNLFGSMSINPVRTLLPFEDYLDLSDIISAEEFEIGDHLELIQREIFPSVDLLEFTRICRKYPILLTLEIENLRAAVDIIGKSCPNVDVNYLIRQKSAGVELFLCCALSWRPTARTWGNDDATSSATVPLSSVSQIIAVEQIAALLGGTSRPLWNVTEFVAKVPHVFHPQYFRRLEDHFATYMRLVNSIPHESFSSVQKESNFLKPKEKFLQLVFSWPSILLVDNLSLAIHSFNASITAAGICTNKYRRIDPSCAKFIMRVLEKEPSALIQPDLAERLALLQTTFPQWDLQRVIFEYPRILTVGWLRFIEKIEEMQVVFGEGCKIEKVIAKHPTILQFNLDRLVNKAAFIASLFPETSLKEVVNSAPGILLSQHSESAVESKVQRVQRLFCRSTSLGGVDVDHLNPSKPKKGFQTPERKRETTASQRPRGGFRPAPAQRGFDGRNENVIGKQRHEIEVGSSEQQVADSYPTGEGEQKDLTALRELESKLEVARIVIGNAEMFSDKFPYFIQRLQIWIEAFDPVMAHTILSARPHLLSRNPPEVRSLLKYLYGSIVTAMASLRQDPAAVDFTQERVYEPKPTLFQKSSTCEAYSNLLQGLNEKLFSPSTDAVTVMQRVSEVTDKADRLLAEQALGDAGWRRVLFLKAPRLLTEPVWRLLLRIALSKEYFSHLKSPLEVENRELIDKVAQDTQHLMKFELLKVNMEDTTSDSGTLSEIGASDDDMDINVDKVLMQAKIDKFAHKYFGTKGFTEDNGMPDLFLSHGEVLVSPPSTYFRLFFLETTLANEIRNTKQVRDVLKMNTGEFLKLLQKSLSPGIIINGYARYLDRVVQRYHHLLHSNGSDSDSISDLAEGDQVLENDPLCFEQVEVLERQLCGVLNDLYADASNQTEEDSPLSHILRIIRETQPEGGVSESIHTS